MSITWIADAWSVYRENCLPPDISNGDLEIYQTIFWAGAQARQVAHEVAQDAEASAELYQDRSVRAGAGRA